MKRSIAGKILWGGQTATLRRQITGGAVAAVAVIALSSAGTASAVTVGFELQSTNAGVDISAELELNVTDSGGGQALFVFTNDDALFPSFINQIYVEDGSSALSGFQFSATNSSGTVNYSAGASPSNPPEIGTFNVDFSHDANSPRHNNGISQGESGGFLADYLSFTLVEAALSSGDLRVALHVQGLGAEGEFSDSYLSLTPSDPALPEPSASLLAALGSLLLLRRRRK